MANHNNKSTIVFKAKVFAVLKDTGTDAKMASLEVYADDKMHRIKYLVHVLGCRHGTSLPTLCPVWKSPPVFVLERALCNAQKKAWMAPGMMRPLHAP